MATPGNAWQQIENEAMPRYQIITMFMKMMFMKIIILSPTIFVEHTFFHPSCQNNIFENNEIEKQCL